MKKLLHTLFITLLFCTGAVAQNYNQNINFTRITQLSGYVQVSDTVFTIVNDGDTTRYFTRGDTCYMISTAGTMRISPNPAGIETNKIFANGITESNDSAKLGGTLVDATTINYRTKSLSILDSSGTYGISVGNIFGSDRVRAVGKEVYFDSDSIIYLIGLTQAIVGVYNGGDGQYIDNTPANGWQFYSSEIIKATIDTTGRATFANFTGGKYLPDTSTVVGTDTVSLDSAFYQRNGNSVTVWGSFTTRIIATSVSFNISLPIASDFTGTFDLSGAAVSSGAGNTARVSPQTTLNRANVARTITAPDPLTWNYSFTYQIK